MGELLVRPKGYWPSNPYTYIFFVDGVPFYVGASKGRRANPNAHPAVTRNSISPAKVLVVIYEEENRSAALSHEKLLIQEYGRADLDLGTLVNKTDGGLGWSNPSEETRKQRVATRVGKELTEEHKRNISRAHIGLKPTAETRIKLSVSQMGNQNALGRKRTVEAKLRMSLLHQGKRHSEETKKKMSEAHKKRLGR